MAVTLHIKPLMLTVEIFSPLTLFFCQDHAETFYATKVISLVDMLSGFETYVKRKLIDSCVGVTTDELQISEFLCF
jgi:hypothetical protein